MFIIDEKNQLIITKYEVQFTKDELRITNYDLPKNQNTKIPENQNTQ